MWLWPIVLLGAIACIPFAFGIILWGCVDNVHAQRHRGDEQATRRSRIFLIIECLVAILLIVLLPLYYSGGI